MREERIVSGDDSQITLFKRQGVPENELMPAERLDHFPSNFSVLRPVHRVLRAGCRMDTLR
jgi:hypothetical protein